MPEGKKFGGFKPASAGSTPRASSSPLQKLKRRLQALTAEILEVAQAREVQDELPLAPVTTSKEPPIEESFTQSDAVLWFVNGITIKDWKCRYGCTPTKLSRGATHHWQCEYWSKEGKNQTPIDRMKPPDDTEQRRLDMV